MYVPRGHSGLKLASSYLSAGIVTRASRLRRRRSSLVELTTTWAQLSWPTRTISPHETEPRGRDRCAVDLLRKNGMGKRRREDGEREEFVGRNAGSMAWHPELPMRWGWCGTVNAIARARACRDATRRDAREESLQSLLSQSGVARHAGARRGRTWRVGLQRGVARRDATAHQYSTHEGKRGTEVVGNHPAARVIASLRRSAAIALVSLLSPTPAAFSPIDPS